MTYGIINFWMADSTQILCKRSERIWSSEQLERLVYKMRAKIIGKTCSCRWLIFPSALQALSVAVKAE
jgi:hypothetical protein